MNKGQTVESDPQGPGREPDTPNGEPLLLTSAKMVPPQESENEAEGWFWINCCEGKLYYDIRVTNTEAGSVEDAAHIFGPVVTPSAARKRCGNKRCEEWIPDEQVAGVRYSLPAGAHKVGNITINSERCDEFLESRYYVAIFYNTGDIRAQLKFVNEHGEEERNEKPEEKPAEAKRNPMDKSHNNSDKKSKNKTK
jgi:hypothetical protein